ncbi:hypothetical protein D3C73_1098510 [compost metagenome]
MVVEAAHPAHCRRLQPRHAVVGQVFVEAGVESGSHRNAEAACGAQRRPAQWALGRHVDRIRALLPPVPAQPDRCWQAEAQAGITRQGRARYQQGIRRRLQRFAGLSRADQVDLMAGRAQSLLQALHGQCDAVDLRRVGFGDDGIAHGGPPVLRMLGPCDVADMTALRQRDDGRAERCLRSSGAQKNHGPEGPWSWRCASVWIRSAAGTSCR